MSTILQFLPWATHLSIVLSAGAGVRPRLAEMPQPGQEVIPDTQPYDSSSRKQCLPAGSENHDPWWTVAGSSSSATHDHVSAALLGGFGVNGAIANAWNEGEMPAVLGPRELASSRSSATSPCGTEVMVAHVTVEMGAYCRQVHGAGCGDRRTQAAANPETSCAFPAESEDPVCRHQTWCWSAIRCP